MVSSATLDMLRRMVSGHGYPIKEASALKVIGSNERGAEAKTAAAVNAITSTAKMVVDLSNKSILGVTNAAAIASTFSTLFNARDDIIQKGYVKDATLLSMVGNVVALAATAIATANPVTALALTIAAVGIGIASTAMNQNSHATIDAVSNLIGDLVESFVEFDLNKYITENIDRPLLDMLLKLDEFLFSAKQAVDFKDSGYVDPEIAAFAPNIVDEFRQGRSGAHTVQRYDPLSLDLDGDGIETTAARTDGVLFDHDGDGIAHGSGWIAADDGWLVLDRNGNGTIDTGAELFGDHTDTRAGRALNAGQTHLPTL